MSDIRIRRLAYALGAEVRGIDLRSLDDVTTAEIRRAWLEHQVLCFPGQNLEKRELVEIARRFGEPSIGSTRSPDPEAPGIKLLTNRPVGGKPAGAYKDGHNWHSDKSFSPAPVSATFLACKEIPAAGGDTMFADMYAAFATLSPAMQRVVEGLDAIHTDVLQPRPGMSDSSGATYRLNVRGRIPVVHPAVRTHPETGRKALYLGYRVSRFVGMSDDESRGLLRFLNEHSVRYEFTYRHRWTPGDAIVWDNRCVMHIALSDYDLQRDSRFMFGVEVVGEQTGHPYTPEDDARAAQSTLLGASAG